MLSVRAGGLDIAYRETGSGDPVFLINGTGESSATWGPLLDALAQRYRCIMVDLRDTGGSSSVDDPYAPADLVGDAAAIADALGTGPAHIIGFSLGGAVAQELAIARSDLVRSLVLLSTWPRSDPWFVSQMRSWQALRRSFGPDADGFDRALEPWMFSPATMEDHGVLGRIRAMWAGAPDQSAEAFHRQCEADIAHDAADRLGTVDAPALVIVGLDDICTPPRYARALADLLPRARLVTIPRAGHCALFEQPDQVRAAIAGFLDEVR